MLDAVFGPDRFRNEVIWKRTGSHGSAKRYGPLHDVLLFYTKSDTYTWNKVYGPYDENYLTEKFGKRDALDGSFKTLHLLAQENEVVRAVVHGGGMTRPAPEGTGRYQDISSNRE